jgi:pimeloyl-ACP methyl ester carboxylesterase
MINIARPPWVPMPTVISNDRGAEYLTTFTRITSPAPTATASWSRCGCQQVSRGCACRSGPQIAAPVTIINGRHDRVVPLPNAEFLAERLPTSRLVVVDGSHFI